MTDLQLAREKQAEFDRWKRDINKQLPVELSVTVLTTGFWPTYKVLGLCHMILQCVVSVVLPLSCAKLQWVHACGVQPKLGCQAEGRAAVTLEPVCTVSLSCAAHADQPSFVCKLVHWVQVMDLALPEEMVCGVEAFRVRLSACFLLPVSSHQGRKSG